MIDCDTTDHDLQHGFTWRGVKIVNPFAEPRDALLERALQTR